MIRRTALLFTMLFGLAFVLNAQTQTVTYTYTGNPVAITVDSADVTSVAEIFVPTAMSISSVSARVVIEYPQVGDLEVTLLSARGTRTVLLDNDCGNLRNVNTTFDDSAPTEYEDFCPTEAGRGPFRAEQPLANSRGELSGGYWSLYVANTSSNTRTGFIRDFSITIAGTPITQPSITFDSIAHSARLDSFGVVSPGELVSIFGVALGPADGMTASALPLPTTLAGTSVTFDGVAVPILYASSLQLNVQAPFTLKPGSLTSIQVRTGAGTSGTIALEVVPAFAGLYTNQSNGRGQVRAINQNGSINSVSNPAPQGSYVSLYGTGLGAPNPPVNTGAAAPSSPLSTVNGLAAIIGGVSTNVAYAGLAPGLVGVYQVNALVPSGIAGGARSVVLLPFAGFPSQPRAFIYVQ
jgi:uncharacterized protein (TIGR03437 family)